MTTVSDLVWGAAVAAVGAFTIWRVALVLRGQRRHHRRANKTFMKGYCAGFRAAQAQPRRTTVEATAASRDYRPPVVRPRTPADAGDPRPLASAGTTRRPNDQRSDLAGAGRTPPDALALAGPVRTERGRHAG